MSSKVVPRIPPGTFRLKPRQRPLRSLKDNPYRPKKVWPPDFSKLSEKEQFRFERRYKRRLKLATARPRWDKMLRLGQLFSISFVLVYSLLFMDWNTEKQPFQWLRDKMWGAFEVFTPQQRHQRRDVDIPVTTNEK
ncbi:hypothetical protein GGR54DRAFT_307880 [Hypoxylon sp. NC1633]|nr:hypothetical protein GGR54DRAFT_307880 [Hypoxylon sp. NC1633]